MSFQSLPPASGGALDRFFARLLGWLVWAFLALMGLVFLASLLIWLAVMVVASLVSSLVTGRPATVTLLWRRWREMARQRWPQRPGAQPSATPRADEVAATGHGATDGVQDVAWRELPRR